jgi:hypothetical protein
LAGYNKAIQKKYWSIIKQSNWNKYRLPSSIEGNDSIVESVLVDNPDFSDLNALTKQIEVATLQFIADVEAFLSLH